MSDEISNDKKQSNSNVEDPIQESVPEEEEEYKLLDPKSYVQECENYIFGKVIFNNQWSYVYRAQDVRNSREAVIKVTAQLGRCEYELDMLDTCRANFVVDVYEAFIVDDRAFLVMESCLLSLNFFYKNKIDISHEEITYFFWETAKALRYLHAGGVVHRDIKLGNIFLTEGGIIKLGDFAHSCFIDELEFKIYTYGTSRYKAPELLLKKEYNSIIDMWSLGVSIAELYVGDWFFDACNRDEAIREVCRVVSTEAMKELDPENEIFDDIKNYPKEDWSQLSKAPPSTLFLIKRLIDVNPETRWTAKKIMQDKLFNEMEKKHPNELILQCQMKMESENCILY